MKMFAVTDSSVIREIGFDNGTLAVKFIQNRTYYFLNEHIKNKYFPLR